MKRSPLDKTLCSSGVRTKESGMQVTMSVSNGGVDDLDDGGKEWDEWGEGCREGVEGWGKEETRWDLEGWE